MSRRTVIIAACATSALVLLLFVTLGYLWTQRVSLTAELAATTTTLTETKETLAQTETTLQETDDVLTSTTRTLENTQATLGDTQTSLDETHADLVQTRMDLNEKVFALQETTENLVAEQEKANTLQADLDVARGDIRTLTADKAKLQEAYHTLEQAQNVLTQEHERLQSQHTSQTRELTDLQQEHSQLQAVNGTITEANAKLQRVQVEIARLEQARQPLILRDSDTRTNGLLCTGSMEPKVTCLDEATILTDYDPADIVVGAIISFQARGCWSDAGPGWVMHRVTDIRHSGGVYYFWPKGDATSSADGCWVPHTAVDGYLIQVHENVHPENTRLRNGVNAAKAALITAREAYLSQREAYGCSREPGTCYVDTDAQLQVLRRLRSAWEAAWTHYDCWYENALDSEYPGHIPYTC